MFSLEDINKALYYINALHIPEDFGNADENAAESLDVDYLAEDLSNAGCGPFHIFHGVSKVVLDIREFPFVIKIPFNGMWYYDYQKDDGESNIFCPFYCACKAAPDDYCYDELIKTAEATAAGYGALVPQMMCVGTINDRKFYLQERAVCFGNVKDSEIKASDASLDKSSKLRDPYKIGNYRWRAAIIERYGADFWKNFCEWNDTCDCGSLLTDFHDNNYGFAMDGRPVIFDLSGFYD